MGRILYGVAGDAGGHVSRSLAIAQQLSGHEVVFVGGGRIRDLARLGYETIPVPLLGTALTDNRVNLTATVVDAARSLAQRSKTVARLKAVIREYDPDLIVTDYEYFLPLAARRAGRPCISADRQHALTHCRYARPAGHRISRLLTLAAIRGLHSAASHYLVCSFLPMEPRDPALAEVFPPVFRAAVAPVRPAAGEHALVYLRGGSLPWLRDLLGGRSRRFIIYGFDIAREEGNLTFRPHAEEGFLRDLATSDYVIANGGHNLISEALYFGKPALCFPVGLFYEQLVNAHLLAEAGYGEWHAPDARAGAALDGFEARLPIYRRHIAGRAPWGGPGIAERIGELVGTGVATRA